MEFYEKAYEMRLAHFPDDQKEIALVLYNIGNSLVKMGEYKKSLESLRKAYKYFKKVPDENSDVLIDLYMLIGFSYQFLNKFKKGVYYSRMGYEMSYKRQDLRCLFNCAYNLAFLYFKKGRTKKSLGLYLEAYQLKCEFEPVEDLILVEILFKIGENYADVQKYNKSLQYIVKCRRVAGSINYANDEFLCKLYKKWLIHTRT